MVRVEPRYTRTAGIDRH